MADTFLRGVGTITINGVQTEHPDNFTIEIETEEGSRRNSGFVGGGEAASYSQISGVRVLFNTGNFDRTTLAAAVKGTAAEESPAAFTELKTTVVEDGVAVIDTLIDTTQAVTVAHDAGAHATDTAFAAGDWIFEGSNLYKATVGGTTGGVAPSFPTDGSTVTDGGVTWQDMGTFAAVADTDFTVRANGVFRTAASGMPVGTPIKVSGTAYGHSRVEIGNTADTTFEVGLDGYNEETNEPLVGLFRIVKFDPASVALVAAEYSAVDMVGRLQIDSSVPTGRSKFGTLRLGDAAIV